MNKGCCNEMKNVFGNAPHSCFSNKTSAKEKNRSFAIDKRYLQDEQFCRINVDNCLIINSNTKKCDFVFVRCANNYHYFVEMKGSDTKHAIKQLESTIKYFIEKTGLKKHQVFAYVVSGRVPSNSNLLFRSLKKQFVKNFAVELKIGTKKFVKTLK